MDNKEISFEDELGYSYEDYRRKINELKDNESGVYTVIIWYIDGYAHSQEIRFDDDAYLVVEKMLKGE